MDKKFTPWVKGLILLDEFLHKFISLFSFFFFYICLSWGCAVYGTQELTIFIPSWGRAMHGTQEVNTLRCCLTLFRPARPDQSCLAVVTTGLRWNGGRYAALPGPLGQHVVVWCIRTLIVAQSSTRLSLTHATAHCAPHTYQPDPAPNKKIVLQN